MAGTGAGKTPDQRGGWGACAPEDRAEGRATERPEVWMAESNGGSGSADATAVLVRRPARLQSSVIFASPHSGCAYPADFLARAEIDALLLRSSEDAFVDRLFASAPDAGAALIAASVPRAYVDLNRACDELDPALIEGLRRGAHNPRVASGLGVIPRVVANGRPIQRGKITLAEAQARINAHWRPYHAQLQRLIDESHAAFGEAILIDCHSMPHDALEGGASPGRPRPDVVLGDRFGASAAGPLVEHVEAAFASAGLRVARNTPFAGAYVTQHYGRPSRRQHAIQVEIDRALYMDERRIEPLPDFEDFRALLAGIIAEIADLGRPAARLVAAE